MIAITLIIKLNTFKQEYNSKELTLFMHYKMTIGTNENQKSNKYL